MWLRIKGPVQFATLVLLDLLAYYLCVFLAVLFQMNLHVLMNFWYIFNFTLPKLLPTVNSVYSIGWIPVVIILVMAFEKLYRVRYPFWEESRVIIKAVSIAMTLIVLSILVRNMYTDLPRTLYVWLWFFLVFVFPVIRYFGKKLLFRIGIWRESALIVGAGEQAQRTIHGLAQEEHLGYRVVGLLDDDPKRIGATVTVDGKNYKVYGRIHHFDKFVNILGIETVFIASPTVSPRLLSDLVSEIYKHVKRVIIVPEIQGAAIFNSELNYLFTEKLFLVRVKNNLDSEPNLAVKRVFDIVLTVLGLVILLPLSAAIALFIRLTSEGPVLVPLRVIGKGGRAMNVYRFRADSSGHTAHRLRRFGNIGRRFAPMLRTAVAVFGRFLRRSGLDDLPQVFSIIKGDMSLVGPRPVTRPELERYYADTRSYYYSVTPGLTGLWQVSGRSARDATFRTQTDVWYVQNWSLWLDIIILLKTVPVLFSKD